jgi:hypothetical protein
VKYCFLDSHVTVSYPGAAHFICELYVTNSMRCEAVAAVSVRIVDFWDVMPPSLVLVSYNHVKGTGHDDRKFLQTATDPRGVASRKTVCL